MYEVYDDDYDVGDGDDEVVVDDDVGYGDNDVDIHVDDGSLFFIWRHFLNSKLCDFFTSGIRICRVFLIK